MVLERVNVGSQVAGKDSSVKNPTWIVGQVEGCDDARQRRRDA